jgi:NADH dehydrogenase FAD-containing subunit
MLPLLRSSRRLVRRGWEVTLLSDHPTLFYSGMVPEWLGGVYSAEEVQIEVVRLAAEAGVGFVHDRAVGLDPATRTVTIASGERLSADLMAVALGSVVPGAEAAGGAVLAKPLHRLERLEGLLDAALAGGGPPFHLVVVGGGAAGAEIALNVTARASAAPGRGRVTLLEPSERLLPAFPEGAGRYALRLLAERGAELRLGAEAVAASGESVRLASGEEVRADAVLWATGTEGPPVLRASGLPVTERGFLRVADTLQCPEAPWLFAAGDSASLASYPTLARVGVHAVKQGPVLRDNVLRAAAALAEGGPPAGLRRFRPYPVAPLILSTGRPEALYVAGGLWARGGWALRVKHLADRRWMRHYAPLWEIPVRRMVDRASAEP